MDDVPGLLAGFSLRILVAGVRCNNYIMGEYFEKSLCLDKKQSQATKHLQENSSKQMGNSPTSNA